MLDAIDACDNATQRGTLLRKEGLYHSRITAWRQQRDAGKLTASKSKNGAQHAKNKKFERENFQLKKKLAMAEAIIDLQKKVSDLFGLHIRQPESSETN